MNGGDLNVRYNPRADIPTKPTPREAVTLVIPCRQLRSRQNLQLQKTRNC
jgi:hypothetical protein